MRYFVLGLLIGLAIVVLIFGLNAMAAYKKKYGVWP